MGDAYGKRPRRRGLLKAVVRSPTATEPTLEASVDHVSVPGGFPEILGEGRGAKARTCCGQGTWRSKTRTGAELRLGCSGLQEKVRIKSGAFGGTGPP